MNEKTKQILVAVVALLAVGAAAFMGYRALGPAEQQLEVVGTIDMGPGGGRDAEKGTPAGFNAQTQTDPQAPADASGMPADMIDGQADGR